MGNTLDNNLVSRQAVLEVIRKCHCEEWVKADIGAPIEVLPSVTPMQKWIPVSERTPDSDSKVLVSTRYEDWNKVVYDVDIAYYAGDNEWAADENCDRYDNTNFIVAWMPLPTPYQSEIQTDEEGRVDKDGGEENAD